LFLCLCMKFVLSKRIAFYILFLLYISDDNESYKDGHDDRHDNDEFFQGQLPAFFERFLT
jgi:hypothetical protein